MKAIQQNTHSLSIFGAGTTGHPHAKNKINLDTYLAYLTEIIWKRVTDINKKCKTIKLEDNIEENLDDFRYGNNFFDDNSKGTIHELNTW